ncbi:hypothetical protein [Prescottella agglutinans]|uniref:Uncharacterized protein n=1 Tax=Prescottella agglutinans TaxID=1644129 RepID=A0ABT6MKR7_9NOCA|nr:hypothetical protein [Prescottella agglutinans]
MAPSGSVTVIGDHSGALTRRSVVQLKPKDTRVQQEPIPGERAFVENVAGVGLSGSYRSCADEL